MRALFLFIAFISTSNASVILLNSGNIETYMTLNLTDRGDVALSTCPMITNPIAECDPDGTSTMVITKSVFDAKLKLAANYDKVTIAEKLRIKNLQKNLITYKKVLKELETQIETVQTNAAGLRDKIAILDKQIRDVENKLQDPNLDPDDRKQLEAFLAKSEYDKRVLEGQLEKVNLELAGLERKKKQQQDDITAAERAVVDAQTKIQNRKTLLDNKSMDLIANLDQKQLATAYEKESLYFVAYFIFDPSQTILDDASCSAVAAFNGSFNNIKATINLTEGVFPKAVMAGSQRIELYNGLSVDLVMSTIGRVGWNYDGVLFEYVSPRSKSKITCDDSNGIDGRKNFEYWDTFKGNLNNDTACDGKPSRWYAHIHMYYVGRMNAKAAAETCAGIKPKVRGRELQSIVMSPRFYDSNTYEWDLIHTLYAKSPMLGSLKVEGHQFLADGYYSWASVQKPYLWEYTAAKANLKNYTNTEHEKTIYDWELPTICSARINIDYCD